MPGQVIAIEGPSAAGKTRVSRLLAERLGAVYVAEAYERVRPRPSLRWTSDRELLRLEQRLFWEETHRYRLARRHARAGRRVVLDTGLFGPLTYTAGLQDAGLASPPVLTALFRTARRDIEVDHWGLPDVTLVLRVHETERGRRARDDPRGHPPSLQRRHQRVAVTEASIFRTVLAPRLRGRLRWVSGGGSPQRVVDRILRALPRMPTAPVRVRPGPVLRALERSAGVSRPPDRG